MLNIMAAKDNNTIYDSNTVRWTAHVKGGGAEDDFEPLKHAGLAKRNDSRVAVNTPFIAILTYRSL